MHLLIKLGRARKLIPLEYMYIPSRFPIALQSHTKYGKWGPATPSRLEVGLLLIPRYLETRANPLSEVALFRSPAPFLHMQTDRRTWYLCRPRYATGRPGEGVRPARRPVRQFYRTECCARVGCIDLQIDTPPTHLHAALTGAKLTPHRPTA